MVIRWTDCKIGDVVTYRRLHQKGKFGTGKIARIDPPGAFTGKTGRVLVTGHSEDHDWDANISLIRVVSINAPEPSA